MKRTSTSSGFSSWPGSTILLGCLFALAAVPGTGAQTAAYTITDLGSLAGTNSYAYGINNAGQVVGYSVSTATGQPNHAALWTVQGDGKVVIKDLHATASGSSIAYGINDAGLMGGYVFLADGGHASHFSVAADGTAAVTILGAFGAQNRGEAFGYGINALGQVPGSNYVGTGSLSHAFLYELVNGAPVNTDLGTLGGDHSTAYAINDAGWIVGNAQVVTGSNPYFGTLWKPNGGGTFAALNLGPRSGATASTAYGINNAGQIVGVSGTGTQASQHAVLWTVSGSTVTVKDLGVLGSVCNAYAINDAGQIVGSYKVSSSLNHGFFCTTTTGLVDINSLVGSNPIATDLVTPINSTGRCINKFGQIALDGTVGGFQHALLLNPASPPVTSSGGTRETSLLAGKPYNSLPVFTNPASGSRNTAFGFLDGVAGSGGSSGTYGSNRDVTIAFTANPATTPLASDAASLTGAAPDVAAIQMSYAPGFADAYFGNGGNGCLGWFDGAHWVNAVDGNTGGAPLFAGDRAYNTATDFRLGTWGIDTIHAVVWAVVNHGGVFGVTLRPEVLQRIKSNNRSGTVTTLAIDSFAGHVYQLQRADTLGVTGFSDVENVQNGSTGSTLYFTHDDGPAVQAFYRIKLDP